VRNKDSSYQNVGSEWRKWDLQVHTPFSHLNNQFGDDFDNYVKKLFKKAIEKEIAVIGITDYFCIEGYKKIKTEYLTNEEKLKELFSDEEIEKIKNITLFPNIEFRLDTLVGSNRVNFHVIFSDSVQIKDIEENFLHELDFVYEGNPQSEDERWKLKLGNIEELGKKLKREHASFSSGTDLFIGMKNAVVNDGQIAKVLKNKRSKFEGEYILCVPSDEDLSEILWNGQDHNVRKTLIQKSDVLFSSNQGTISWGLGKKSSTILEFIDEFKTLKPCIWGSDAHDYEKLFEPDNNRYTWIKADTTFEGLKQITYEPDERVIIQDVNPSFEYNKPYFNELMIQNEVGIFQDSKDQVYFTKTILPLNKNLVTIIGGRGTGKSMLVDYLASIFKNYRNADSKYSESHDFKLKYAKDNILEPSEENYSGGSENYLDFIYIPQRRLKEITEKNKIGDEVKKLLNIEDLFFSLEVDEEIQNALNAVDELRDWFNKEDEKGQKLNSKAFVEDLKKINEELLKSITTAANKKKLEIYTANISDTRELESKIAYLDNLVVKITETQKALNESIVAINTQLPEKDGYKKVPILNFEDQLSALSDNKGEIIKLTDEKEKQNQAIKSDFEKEGFTGDLLSLLKNAETYQSQIKWTDKQLELISKKEMALDEALKNRNALGAKIKAEYEEQKNKIDKAWSSILDKHEGKNKELIEKILLKEGKIVVVGEIDFDEHIFYHNLHKLVDRRTFRDIQALKTKFKISTFEEWIDFVSTGLKGFLDGESSDKFVGLKTLLFGLKERGEYLRTVPKITYDGKELDRLSVGQRGTVYLCLKLATDAFSKPIIFDQPEDDLDNEFIMNELIDIFKELKKYRQIVIVSHNANLVVNADAEQVIIAYNKEEKLSYKSGALEDPFIIDGACTVLEGGKDAFEKRKNKYRFK